MNMKTDIGGMQLQANGCWQQPGAEQVGKDSSVELPERAWSS